MNKLKIIPIKIGLAVFSLVLLLSLAIGVQNLYAEGTDDNATAEEATNTDESGSSEFDHNRDRLRDRLRNLNHKEDQLRDRLETNQEKFDARVDSVQNNLDERQQRLSDRENITPEERAERQADLDQKREEARERLDDRREKLQQERKERILAYVKRIFKRMDAAIERLGKITDRVETRISKLEEEHGIELTEARNVNLMFKTFVGPVEDEASIAYLRPETAQGILLCIAELVAGFAIGLPRAAL